MYGYANVRNVCLLAASILTADAALLIDDDEVFEMDDYVQRAMEFIGRRVYGDVVHGVAGYYLNSKNQYYDDVKPEPWMTYWDRFGSKGEAFDRIIGSGPRLKRTPFAFGGAMTLHRELFECVPFDPLVPRGEDVDYVINSRMFGFSFFPYTLIVIALFGISLPQYLICYLLNDPIQKNIISPWERMQAQKET